MMPFDSTPSKSNSKDKRTLVDDSKPAKKPRTSGRKQDEFTQAFTKFKKESRKVTHKTQSLAVQINQHTMALKQHDEQREKMWTALRDLRDKKDPQMNSVEFMGASYAAYKAEYDSLKVERDEANVILAKASEQAKAYEKERVKKPHLK